MHGVSEVIAIILILMITIAIAGLAYTFMSSTMASTTAAASATVTTTTSSMLASFTIESVDIAKVYVRNTGQSVLSSLSVYVNDEPAVYSITPSVITVGQTGTVTIFSFIPDGAVIKITTPSGFSTSKASNPCSKAISCWKLDEGTGTMTYDSSPYGNSGTLTNGPSWASGRYGSGIQFDGVDDYVDTANVLNMNDDFTISMWVKFPSNYSEVRHFFSRGQDGSGSGWSVYFGRRADQRIEFSIVPTSPSTSQYVVNSDVALLPNIWYYVSGSFVQNANITVYINGVFAGNTSVPKTLLRNSTKGVMINGRPATSVPHSNATIDEVRIYSRAIYG